MIEIPEIESECRKPFMFSTQITEDLASSHSKVDWHCSSTLINFLEYFVGDVLLSSINVPNFFHVCQLETKS